MKPSNHKRRDHLVPEYSSASNKNGHNNQVAVGRSLGPIRLHPPINRIHVHFMVLKRDCEAVAFQKTTKAQVGLLCGRGDRMWCYCQVWEMNVP